MAATANALFGRIEGDVQRIKRPFGIDLLRANEVLHNTAATDDEMRECLLEWCGKHQPCLFGRSAARQGRLHFSILTEKAVRTWSDEEIASKIAEDRKLWKQRALSDVGHAGRDGRRDPCCNARRSRGTRWRDWLNYCRVSLSGPRAS